MNSIHSVTSLSGRACLLFCCAALVVASPAAAAPVLVPDNGSGTAHFPILADYTAESNMEIVDGLVGGTIQIAPATFNTPAVYAEQSGGSLGGTRAGGGGGGLFTWQMQGTGALAAFNRTITFPNPGPNGVISFLDSAFSVIGADYEVHAKPRTLNAPFQSFETDMFRMFNQITGDPDFDLLRFVGGTDFGLPSPGHTKLLKSGAQWEVDSYFDITYRIDFIGKPGGLLSGMSGSTTRTVRISLGDPIVPEPTSAVLLSAALLTGAAAMRRRR